ncbi:hypothetical protein CBM2589_U10042 [Cupriavidus taiwanensis]|uniref:Uncharacterized protein n=1 Tax=Cupriavidus taiwanensis TaxID=164546 RepID=A0A375CQ34_9BURK|nr:hypothetical protein [Cupriavidus taiwanensis]SOY77525.1 hypothetical protein CBM2589_U10042 [Cupriavidus taiwanensis]
MHFLDNNSKAHFEARVHTPRFAEDYAAVGNQEGDLFYVVEAGRGFDALKCAASLLTGTLLLDLTGSERTVQDQTITQKALDALKEARDHVLSSKPNSDRAAHHKHHMLLALEHLTDAAAHSDKSANLIRDVRSEAVFQAIRSAWSELNKLKHLINGFRTIDLNQSCCAYHAKQIERLVR